MAGMIDVLVVCPACQERKRVLIDVIQAMDYLWRTNAEPCPNGCRIAGTRERVYLETVRL
jgi:hypothetical protein